MRKQTGGLDPEVLKAALEGLEAQLRGIEEQMKHVEAMLPGGRGRRAEIPPGTATAIGAERGGATRKKRTLSPEARARISAAQKRRWAAAKRGGKKRG